MGDDEGEAGNDSLKGPRPEGARYGPGDLVFRSPAAGGADVASAAVVGKPASKQQQQQQTYCLPFTVLRCSGSVRSGGGGSGGHDGGAAVSAPHFQHVLAPAAAYAKQRASGVKGMPMGMIQASESDLSPFTCETAASNLNAALKEGSPANLRHCLATY